MLEKDYQAHLIKRLQELLPGCIVIKNDPTYRQGFPDLLILFNNMWAALEVKKNKNAHHQPNQDYYIEELQNMSYAAFIFPENEEDILSEILRTFGVDRPACFSEC